VGGRDVGSARGIQGPQHQKKKKRGGGGWGRRASGLVCREFKHKGPMGDKTRTPKTKTRIFVLASGKKNWMQKKIVLEKKQGMSTRKKIKHFVCSGLCNMWGVGQGGK